MRGGFFAFARYISHVTGSMSLLADVLYLQDWWSAAVTFIQRVVFCCRCRAFGLGDFMDAADAFPWQLWVFHVAGSSLSVDIRLVRYCRDGMDFGGSDFIMPSLALFLLCFIMGMHNTVITLLSGGAIRSTHMTGTATDLGIEISRALYYSKQHHPRLPHVRVNKPKMWLLSGLMLSFLLGGVVGAWGYHLVGHHFALPVSAVLLILGAGSVGYDVKVRLNGHLSAGIAVKRKNGRNRKETCFLSGDKAAKRSEKCRNVSVLC